MSSKRVGATWICRREKSKNSAALEDTQSEEELVMTQFMKLLLAGTIAGMVMTTAAIGRAAAAEHENRITVLNDAFGKDPSMRKDWGFSALVEIAGKRILFDTGNDRDVFA